MTSAVAIPEPVSNAEIADRLTSLAQLLAAERTNFYKAKAYNRAASRIRNLSESVEDLVREEADLTQYEGIGEAIAHTIREIVLTGGLKRLDKLRTEAPPELAGISEYPRLDPKRVLRIYKKLGISSVDALREKLETGEIESALGQRMAQHVRQALGETHAMLLYHADALRAAIEEYLLNRCAVQRVEATGHYRRRVEVIDELSFLIETDDFPAVVRKLQRYGGRTQLVTSDETSARFALSAGIHLGVDTAPREGWGVALIRATASEEHLRQLNLRGLHPAASEHAAYEQLGLAYIEPELREGHGEIELARAHNLPTLVEEADIRGELHAHSTSSDGSHSIEQMAAAARERGYEYLGITDHSQSLKIARGVSMEALWQQIRFIDQLNEHSEIRILKSSEVDILADGSLDYPDDLLRELDYTVCSIHSRFGLNREAQTERLLRAMDNRYFNILGHATGRLLLKRPGYEIDIERVISHAANNGCFFEINSSPDRLDLSADQARLARAAGIKIAVNTDAHHTRDFRLTRYGLDQARRAGLSSGDILNCLPWTDLAKLFRR